MYVVRRGARLIVACLVLAGCGRVGFESLDASGMDGGATDAGAGTDAGSFDAGPDAGLDAGFDGGLDAGADACAPSTCVDLGADCGEVDDGCGTPLTCGSCAAPRTCGGGGVANVCGPDRSWAVPAGGAQYPGPVSLELVSDNPAAAIHYTTDGSAPTTASASGTGVVSSVSASSGVPVRFFASSAAGDETVQSETVTIGGPATTNHGFTAFDNDLGGTGDPIAFVAPGASVSVSSSIQLWAPSTSGGNIVQVLLALEDTPISCMVDLIPGVYPGRTTTGTGTVVAPSTPGTYMVYAEIFQEFRCTDAFPRYMGSTHSRRRRIGVLVVR